MNMDECIVCYKGYEPNASGFVFSCDHQTCSDCAGKWSISCPMCRCVSKRVRAIQPRIISPDELRYIESRIEDNERHLEMSVKIEHILRTKHHVNILRKWYSKRELDNRYQISFHTNTDTIRLCNIHKSISRVLNDTPFSITIMHVEKVISVHF
jgi:hypothetical protein